MEKTIRYSLGKNERLKSRKAIEQLFKNGETFSVSPFRIVYTCRGDQQTINGEPLQAGFTVSTKYFKKAVDRNRTRRLMKECWRLQKNELKKNLLTTGKALAVFLLYTGNEIPGYDLVFERTGAVIKRLQKIINENAAGNM